MFAFTCAHRTLSFGTKIKVTNLENGKWVMVRVNDRGPFVEGRILDLSYAAAKKIGLVATGIAKVKIEIVNKK
jgi:rare lipoprotein A